MVSMTASPDSDAIAQLLRDVADQVIIPRFRALADGQIDEKTPGDYVTVADREAEALITEWLHTHAPDALVVGEEAVFADRSILDGIGKAPHAFTVDPVDGTANFVKGSLDYAVMIAELIDAQVYRSWIWQPAHQILWTATRGQGVTRNGVTVHVGRRSGQRGAASWRSIWPAFPTSDETNSNDMKPLVPTHMCAGMDYPSIVDDELDFVIYKSPKPWDHCPGMLMLHEIGGGIMRIDGKPYTPDSPFDVPIVAACNLDLVARVASVVRHAVSS